MLTTIAIFAIAGGSALLAAIYLAPEGYQDERGFNYGQPTDSFADADEIQIRAWEQVYAGELNATHTQNSATGGKRDVGGAVHIPTIIPARQRNHG